MKKTVLLAMMMAAAAASFGAFYANMGEEDAYLSAMDSFDKKDYSTAQKGFDEFLQKFPDSKYRPNAMLKAADMKEETADKDRAYSEVIKDYPNSEFEAEAVFSLGRMYYVVGNYKKSRELLNIILNKYRNMVWVEESYYYIVLCYLAEKNYDLMDKAYMEYSQNKDYFKQKKKMELAYADSLLERAKFPEAAAIYKGLMDSAESQDKSLYMPAVYKKAAMAYERAGDGKTAGIISTDLKLKFPDSVEATGQDTKPVQTAAVQAQATPKPEATAAAAGAVKSFFTVQIGAYSNKKFCDITAKKYEDKKYPVFIKKEGKFFRIMVGKLATKEEAEVYAKDFIKKEKLKNYLVKQGWE
jgi:cell division septation protein DedD